MDNIICDKCGHELEIAEFPFCPHEKGANVTAISDSIEGGLMIEHGLCWPNGEPRRWDSKQAIAKEAKAKGLHWGAFIHGSPSGRRWV